MSSWDREAEIGKYTHMFDESEDEGTLIETLGTPTQIAISIAKDYKPSPRPGSERAPEPEPERGAEQKPEPEPEPEPPPPPKKRDELQIVTGGDFEYGMELALLMGEPISAAVESALAGKYLPDPDFSLEEILREAQGEEAGPAREVPEPPETEPPETEPLETESPEPEPPETHKPEAEAEAEAEKAAAAGDESAGDGEAPEGETPPAAEGGEEDEPGADGMPEPEGPVFDAATAPLPEAVRSADADSGEKAALEPVAPFMPDPSKFAELGPDMPVLPDPSKFAELGPDVPDGPEEDDAPPRRALRPVMTAVYALFLLAVGLPVALALTFVGVPVLLLGGGTIALVAYAEMNMIPALSMFSDILLVGGAGLAVCGVGLLTAWLGLWVSIELGSMWINGVVLNLGGRMCYKKEAGGE